jgi:hypothetical protein
MAERTDFQWEDPPPKYQRPPGDLAKLLPALQQRPGEWARLRTYATQASAGGVTAHLARRYGPDGYEFVNRGKAVYGRFVGEGEHD